MKLHIGSVCMRERDRVKTYDFQLQISTGEI
jgi:hypothetical protein